MKPDRLGEMETYINKAGTVSLQDLCSVFHVSMSTVRRDVTELTRLDRIQKVYGGVIGGGKEIATDLPIASESEPSTKKRQLGYLAASLVRNGMSVFLDSGIETLHVLPYLAEKSNITVISHSLTVLAQAARYASLNVIALGGIYNCDTSTFTGQSALDDLAKMSIDLVFLSADGVTIERGLTSYNYTEIEIKKNVAKWNRDLVLIVDGKELGRNALITFCEIGSLHAIVSDKPMPQDFLRANLLSKVRLLMPPKSIEEGMFKEQYEMQIAEC